MADMAEQLSELKDEKNKTGDKAGSDPVASGEPQQPAVPKLDALGRAYATGRRKQSTARVWLSPGTGKIIVNGHDQSEYFGRPTLRLIINQPVLRADRINSFDVKCTVSGGGLSGQAGAVRHGIARALVNFEPEVHSVLKTAKLLTRDSRRVERKKYGRRKARRSKQWAKR